jgi:hypothetical protein
MIKVFAKPHLVWVGVYIFFASFLFCCHPENPQVGGEKKDEPTKKEKAPT